MPMVTAVRSASSANAARPSGEGESLPRTMRSSACAGVPVKSGKKYCTPCCMERAISLRSSALSSWEAMGSENTGTRLWS